jgi:hypothetical protein
MSHVIVCDIETVPDLKGFAAANGHIGKTDDEVRAELGDKWTKSLLSRRDLLPLTARPSTFPFCVIGPWSTEWQHRVWRRVRISTATPRMRSICATCWHRSVHRPKQASLHELCRVMGLKLANDGHDTRAIQAYLGHRSIMSTVRYTALTPYRFKNFWKD